MTNRSHNSYGAMILPDGKYYSLDDRETRRNNNVLVVGTTGAAKTRTVITPNLLECVGSYVVTDPKGNLYCQWGDYLKTQGYRVVRLSFIHPEESVHYNPLNYVTTTQQIQQLSSVLINKNKSGHADPFWDDSSLMLLNSLIAYVKECPGVLPAEENFHAILELLRMAGRGNSIRKDSVLSQAMEKLHEYNEKSWAYKQFQNVNQSPDKTFDTIIATTIAKFCSMDTDELAEMMQDDEIDIISIGQQKTAVFVEVSDSDRSMDALINLFFTQTMNQLCICKIENFENMISNIRSRKISVILILQSLSQLENSYGQSAHTIVDDCDTLIYMGGNDPETAHSIAVRCNKTTQTILHMPICTSWIFRRGEKPFMCRNMELDDYLQEKKIISSPIERKHRKEIWEQDIIPLCS